MNELYESITQTNILSHAFYNEEDNEADNEADNDEETQESISFTAESVKPLSVLLKKGKLTNQETTKMIHDLSKQIAYLETKMQQTFYGYNLDDIVVINEDIFFIASTKNLARIETKNNSIYFYKPIDKPYFSNPELNELTKLPAKIDYRSSYYSLGALILFCSTNIYIFSELKETDIILSPIYYTKLYWFLKRCFHEDCKQRILLFI
jgi:polyhydroxyalkanoate synthesis regulator phasin